jgi:hypothetical protein
MTYNVIYFTMDVESGRDDHPATGEKREREGKETAGTGNGEPERQRKGNRENRDS